MSMAEPYLGIIQVPGIKQYCVSQSKKQGPNNIYIDCSMDSGIEELVEEVLYKMTADYNKNIISKKELYTSFRYIRFLINSYNNLPKEANNEEPSAGFIGLLRLSNPRRLEVREFYYQHYNSEYIDCSRDSGILEIVKSTLLCMTQDLNREVITEEELFVAYDYLKYLIDLNNN